MYPALSHQDGKSLGTAVRMQPTLNIPGSVFLHTVLWGGKKEKKNRLQQTVMVRKMYMLSSTG